MRRTDPAARLAVARGIPVAISDLLLNALAVDEAAITLDATLMDDLGADSLDVIELAMDCERHFRITISDAVTERWQTATVRAVIADLRRLGVRV